MSALPPELLHALNQAYLLHVLATDPARVVPPGKSLLSMMPRALPVAHDSPLHVRVEELVHKAFWDEALVSLASPSPAVQLSRLKLLYSDLYDALQPLFPPDHPILLTLRAPLSPTSSPLHSTLAFLQEILVALRQRCAPVRDPDVDALLEDLASPPLASSSQSENPLAVLIVESLRAMIALAETLKHDLTDTLLGAMSEAQLTHVLRQQARQRERELILEWPGVRSSDLADHWNIWCGDALGGWTARLVRALASPTPVTSNGPSDPQPNALPLQLFFCRPTLLYVQNYLQALVVAAALKALVRLPVAPSTSSDFMPRVWSLLKSEIDRDEYTIAGADTGDSGVSETKIINLADEVVRARRLLSSASHSENEERELRAAVERTLQLTDPVFKLLQARLTRAIEEHFRDAQVHKESVNAVALPQIMRTGRVAPGARSPPINSSNIAQSTPVKTIKGFEDEVLVQGIEEVVSKVTACIDWVEWVWGDALPT
ncbi:hypothetical protein H0H81_002942 [Sphagnurus paluster]|uniref:Uncharacterized protein n=1 Tax=Sphagnurus paluster TaxID=117069 RepID=A0A9P7FY45_9AGAR|nr:hypothetical protein H0H81_002942 [Sphagnurus paluster]